MTSKATLLKNNDLEAIQKVLYYANEEQTVGRMIELMEDDSLILTDITRSGRRVCWYMRGKKSFACYCDTLDMLTEEELSADVL